MSVRLSLGYVWEETVSTHWVLTTVTASKARGGTLSLMLVKVCHPVLCTVKLL